jgi:hypothetical protein
VALVTLRDGSTLTIEGSGRDRNPRKPQTKVSFIGFLEAVVRTPGGDLRLIAVHLPHRLY